MDEGKDTTTTTRMTAEQRAEIRALVDATTPGEWTYRRNTFTGVGFDIVTDSPDGELLEVGAGIRRRPDAEFVVRAAMAIDALLDELAAVERERDVNSAAVIPLANALRTMLNSPFGDHSWDSLIEDVLYEMAKALLQKDDGAGST